MTADPKHIEHDDSEDTDSEEMVNDSLGEVTPADSTGLDSDEVRKGKHPSAPPVPSPGVAPS